MTENKRFRAMIDNVFHCAEVYDTENNNKMICMCRLHDKEDIIELLNELNDENKQLKNKLQTYKTTNSLLKATMDRHRTENQQIRDTINEMHNNERTALGRSVLRQLLEKIE